MNDQAEYEVGMRVLVGFKWKKLFRSVDKFH